MNRYTGLDDTEAVECALDDRALPIAILVAPDWRRRLPAEEIDTALHDAHHRARRRMLEATAATSPAGGTPPTAVSTSRPVFTPPSTVAEYLTGLLAAVDRFEAADRSGQEAWERYLDGVSVNLDGGGCRLTLTRVSLGAYTDPAWLERWDADGLSAALTEGARAAAAELVRLEHAAHFPDTGELDARCAPSTPHGPGGRSPWPT